MPCSVSRENQRKDCVNMKTNEDEKTAFSDQSVPRKSMDHKWLDRQLAPMLASARKRLTTKMVLVSSMLALLSGISSFAYSSMTLDVGLQGITDSLEVASLSIVISLMTAAGLYPALRRREEVLLKNTTTIAHNNIEVLALLGKLVELYDPETNGHNLRVSLYTVMFCEALGLSPDEVVRATKGALLHDIGKVMVPDYILGKPGPLTPEERHKMQTHVRHGMELVAQAEILNEAAPVIAGHHERYDGTGYPRGLKGVEIPLVARIFAIIDVFDALTSRRVYKPAYSVADALATMADQRSLHFDPILFDQFVELAPGFVSLLPRQETALVDMLNKRLLRYFDHFTHIEPLLPEWEGTPLADEVR